MTGTDTGPSTEQIPDELSPDSPWYLEGKRPFLVGYTLLAIGLTAEYFTRQALAAELIGPAVAVALIGIAACVMALTLFLTVLWEKTRDRDD